MIGTVKFEARIRELVENLPDLAVLVEPLVVVRRKLWPNLDDGRVQAATARAFDLTTSIPSVNLAPRMIFGN